MNERLIIAGASTRAAAESAVKSGFRAWCIDQFGDEDLRKISEHVEVVENWPDGILNLVPQIPPGTLVITGALENSPKIIAKLRERLTFAGPSSDSIRALRDPVNLQEILGLAGLDVLEVALIRPASRTDWLRKPICSAAGMGLEFFSPTSAITNPPESVPGFYFQQFRNGKPLAGLFLATEHGCHLLGMTLQLQGIREAGCGGFQYCGSIGPLTTADIGRSIFDKASRIGQQLVTATGFRGLFGCDFIWNLEHNTLHVCEVNPRYTASAEIVERQRDIPLMRWHINACLGVPTQHAMTKIADDTKPDSYLGKLICFAERELSAHRVHTLASEMRIADMPQVDSQIQPGQPVCTVFASAANIEGTQDALLALAARILRSDSMDE